MDEFVYRIGSPSAYIGKPPKFYHSNALSGRDLRFCSIYAVRTFDAKCIEEAQTAASFRGLVWSQRLWIDLDTQEASAKARIKIKELGYDHVVYDTGNRGVHIGIARASLPSHTLPQQDKAWVSSNIVGADLSLYWHLHLIRLPGVLHEKTGKPKKFIERFQGKELNLPKWEPETSSVDIRATNEVNNSRTSIFTCWEILQNLTPTGHRRQLVELAVALRRDAKVSIEEAMWVVNEVNLGFKEPRDTNDVERIVRWAYNERD